MFVLLLASTIYIGSNGPTKIEVEDEVKKHAVISEGKNVATVTERTGITWEDKPKWVYEFKDAKEAFKILWEEGYQRRCVCPVPVNSWYNGSLNLGK